MCPYHRSCEIVTTGLISRTWMRTPGNHWGQRGQLKAPPENPSSTVNYLRFWRHQQAGTAAQQQIYGYYFETWIQWIGKKKVAFQSSSSSFTSRLPGWHVDRRHQNGLCPWFSFPLAVWEWRPIQITSTTEQPLLKCAALTKPSGSRHSSMRWESWRVAAVSWWLIAAASYSLMLLVVPFCSGEC